MPEICYFSNRFILPFFTFEPVNSIKCFKDIMNWSHISFFPEHGLIWNMCIWNMLFCVPVYFTGSVLNRFNKINWFVLYPQRFLNFHEETNHAICFVVMGDWRHIQNIQFYVMVCLNGLVLNRLNQITVFVYVHIVFIWVPKRKPMKQYVFWLWEIDYI